MTPLYSTPQSPNYFSGRRQPARKTFFFFFFPNTSCSSPSSSSICLLFFGGGLSATLSCLQQSKKTYTRLRLADGTTMAGESIATALAAAAVVAPSSSSSPHPAFYTGRLKVSLVIAIPIMTLILLLLCFPSCIAPVLPATVI